MERAKEIKKTKIEMKRSAVKSTVVVLQKTDPMKKKKKKKKNNSKKTKSESSNRLKKSRSKWKELSHTCHPKL